MATRACWRLAGGGGAGASAKVARCAHRRGHSTRAAAHRAHTHMCEAITSGPLTLKISPYRRSSPSWRKTPPPPPMVVLLGCVCAWGARARVSRHAPAERATGGRPREVSRHRRRGATRAGARVAHATLKGVAGAWRRSGVCRLKGEGFSQSPPAPDTRGTTLGGLGSGGGERSASRSVAPPARLAPQPGRSCRQAPRTRPALSPGAVARSQSRLREVLSPPRPCSACTPLPKMRELIGA